MKQIIILLLAVIMFTACDQKSHKLDSTKAKIESNDQIEIRIQGVTEVVIDTTGITMYKHKVRYYSYELRAFTSSYVLLNNVFDYGEVLLIERKRILKP